MTRLWKASAIALLALLTMAPMASARGRAVIVGGYGFYGGPAFFGGGWYGPYYGPYWGAPSYAYPATGNVKILTHVKDQPIYVDGGYVGVTGKAKKLALRPGNHNIEVRDPSGHAFYQERVYVLAGRTVEVHPGS